MKLWPETDCKTIMTLRKIRIQVLALDLTIMNVPLAMTEGTVRQMIVFPIGERVDESTLRKKTRRRQIWAIVFIIYGPCIVNTISDTSIH